jgi:hypothetical protein
MLVEVGAVTYFCQHDNQAMCMRLLAVNISNLSDGLSTAHVAVIYGVPKSRCWWILVARVEAGRACASWVCTYFGCTCCNCMLIQQQCLSVSC